MGENVITARTCPFRKCSTIPQYHSLSTTPIHVPSAFDWVKACVDLTSPENEADDAKVLIVVKEEVSGLQMRVK